MTADKLSRAESVVLLNKNTTWLSDSGAWTFYLTLIFLTYCVACTIDTGLAWTYTHLAHSLVTFYFFHWNKGSPFQEDQVGKDVPVSENTRQSARQGKFERVSGRSRKGGGGGGGGDCLAMRERYNMES